MATTFKRIKTLIEFSRRKKIWESSITLAEEFRKTKNKDFKTSGDGSKQEDYMKINTLRKLIFFAVELELLERIGPNDEIGITEKSRKSLSSDDDYKRQIKSSVKSYLISKKVPLTDIIDAVGKIQLPDLPDVPTIYENLKDNSNISESDLRKALFILALSEGINRRTKVIYLK